MGGPLDPGGGPRESGASCFMEARRSSWLWERGYGSSQSPGTVLEVKVRGDTVLASVPSQP